ncbi:TPA: type II secretion system F family protein [Vibrio vulnificus]|nr:type II secretion system F family protein [Vibrio vulnificus]
MAQFGFEISSTSRCDMDELLASFGDIQLNEQWVLLALILISTSLLVVTVAVVFSGNRAPVKKKLEQIHKEVSGKALKKKNRKVENTLESLAPIVVGKDSKERESVRSQLMHAGFHNRDALTVFYAIKTFFAVLGFGGAAAVFFLLPDMDNSTLVMVIAVAGGLYIPNIGLNHFVKKRQRMIRAGVPDALDLLVVCTESGLGFNAALRKVADELAISHPEFADELDTVCAKIKAGVEMSTAFEELVTRTGLSEINGLVNMLSHASKIGGSLSQTLRDYTEDFRDKRNQEVEEIAAKIPTKMIFPLLLFIWPCFFIVAVGPALLSLSDALG